VFEVRHWVNTNSHYDDFSYFVVIQKLLTVGTLNFYQMFILSFYLGTW